MENKKIRYDRLAILVFAIITILFLLTTIINNIVKKCDLKGHSEVLEVEGYKYTNITQTNVLSTPNEQNRLCGLEVVECKNEVEKTDLDIIKELSNEYGVDWKLIESIVRHETGNRTSRAYKELNNPGGWQYWSSEQNTMVFYQFNSIEEGYEFMVKTLKNNYINQGLTTIEQIGNKYCPVGINDKGQNQYWIPKVNEIYESLEV